MCIDLSVYILAPKHPVYFTYVSSALSSSKVYIIKQRNLIVGLKITISISEIPDNLTEIYSDIVPAQS